MDQPSASSKVIESPDLWFPSGNIIVRTMSQTTPPTIRLYKVHKDILALHCASFAALFDSPHDALDAGSERHDGVPVMDLTDAEDDVVSFVKALYYPSETQQHPQNLTPYGLNFLHYSFIPATYPAILKLAAKYEAVRIHELVSKVIRAEWPSSLRAWDAHRKEFNAVQSDYDSDAAIILEECPNPANAIRLARECNLPDILPCAYYDLMCAVNESRADSMSVLTHEELQKFILGQSHFQQRFVRSLSQVFKSKQDKNLRCSNPDGRKKCILHADEWWQKQRCPSSLIEDPIAFLGYCVVDILKGREACDRICIPCRHTYQSGLNTERIALWLSLPSVFGLKNRVSPNWGSEDISGYYFSE